MKTIARLIGRALCTWLGFHAYSPVAEEYDLSGRVHQVRECRYCGHRVWLGAVPLPARVRAEASAGGPLGEGFVGAAPDLPDPDAPAVGAYVTPENYAARVAALRAQQARQRPPQRPARPVTALRGRALGDNLLDRVAHLRTDRRPDEVAAQVMEEGVGRTAPLEPRRWATDRGFGPMREW
jgi:hypothetical protein